MSKNHAKELFGKFNENTDDYDKYIDTVKYCESIEDEIRSEENVKFHAKLRRLEGLLSCPNWRERKNDMLSLIHKVQAEIELKYGDCIAKESKTMCSQVGKHIKGEDNGKIIYAEKITCQKFINLFKLHAKTKDEKDIEYMVASRAKEVDELKAINPSKQVDAVAIRATTEEGKLALIRQYRYAIGGYIYELPAGLVDDGESVCDAAIREMHEETGLTLEITDLPIGNKGGYSSAGMTDETCTLVVGKVTGEISDKYKEASEEIEVLLVDKKEAARILKEENVCIRLALVLMMFIHE